MNRIFQILSSAIVLCGLWLCLNLNLNMQELILGLSVSILIAIVTGGAFTGNILRLLKPTRFIALLGYVFYFLGKMVMANIDVLFRVLHPVIPVKPGIVRVPFAMKSERARNIVANSITLTPGTLTIEMTDDAIFVHWISLPEGDVHKATQKMVSGFTRRLEKVFE